MSDEVKQIQENFQESLDNWADILLAFEIKIDEVGVVPEKYTDDAMMDATILFRHVLFNIGFHRKLINEENAAELGEEIAAMIKKYAGIDSKTFYHERFSKN